MPRPEAAHQDWSKWKAPETGKPKTAEEMDAEALAAANQYLESIGAKKLKPGTAYSGESMLDQMVSVREGSGRQAHSYDKDVYGDTKATGRGMAEENVVHLKTSSFREMQDNNIRNLKHDVDMSGAVELGATGTDDEPFVIEHDPHLHK